MLSTRSSQKIRITSRVSTPYGRKIRAISLANDTLVAWKALQAYFSASAQRTSTCRISRPRKANRPVRDSRTRGSAVPTTTNGGSKKSATPEPSRRNSGHIAVPTLQPAGRGPKKVGATTSSPVPGGTVLRTTTAWNPDAGGAAIASAVRMSSSARRR